MPELTIDQALELAFQCFQSGRAAEAESIYRQIISVTPNFAQAYNNLAIVLTSVGRFDEAIANCQKAIALMPTLGEAHGNLGNALRSRGDLERAIASYRSALELNPRSAEMHNNLGSVLNSIGRLDEAIAEFQIAIHLNPSYPHAHVNLANVLKDEGRVDEAIAECRAAIALAPNFAGAGSNLLYNLHFHPKSTPRSLYEEHLAWNERHAMPLLNQIEPHSNDRSPARRLKIGFVSPDFRQHPVGRFLIPLFNSHDHSQFEIVAYSDVSNPDVVTHQLQAKTDQWLSTPAMSDDQLAQQIRADQIDVLVDLTQHMAGNRLLTFARKPAPVQVSYLGYPGTTGLTTIDYRLTDPYLDPPGSDQGRWYTEKSFRLRRTYWCYAPTCPDIPVAPLPVDNNQFITFGSLNNFCKVSDPTLMLWCQLLNQLTNSRLVLHAQEGGPRRRVLSALSCARIDPRRVSFVGKLPIEDYYHQYDQIDITLDPFPYTGGTTSCGALWMGVPVITLAGATAVARGGVSILSNVGLSELIAKAPEDYFKLAVELASDRPRLAELRASLRDRMQVSPLMNAAQFTRDIESAYRQMWRNWCKSQGGL